MVTEEQLRVAILRKLHQWIDAMPDPDRPFIGFAGSGVTLSPKQIVEQVEMGTPRGERFVQNWMRLAVEHVMGAALVGSTYDRASSAASVSTAARGVSAELKGEKAAEGRSATSEFRSEAK